jgi:hypothetical protein
MAASSALAGEAACAKPTIELTSATTPAANHDISLEQTMGLLLVEFLWGGRQDRAEK